VTLAQLLAERPHVLLDFDGPVCAVFGGTTSAPEAARVLAGYLRSHGVRLPDDAGESGDPFDVLRVAQGDDVKAAEAALRQSEVRAVATAPITPGLRETLDALQASRHTITIVSNNSAAAVGAFVTTHGLHGYITGIVGRTAPDPSLLKPHPHLVRKAISERGTDAASCVLIGDSTTDVEAAQQAGTAVVAYANKPGKREAFEAQRPDAIIETMHDIAAAASVHPAR